MKLNPYLALENCEEALNFYAGIFDGTVTNVMRNKDMPNGGMSNVPPDTIMHMHLDIGGQAIMATQQAAAQGDGTPLITLQTEWDSFEKAHEIFVALAEGGQIKMPFEKTFWSEGFGYVVDQFNVSWIVNVSQ